MDASDSSHQGQRETAVAILTIFTVCSIFIFSPLYIRQPGIEELESLGASNLAQVLDNSVLLRASYVGLIFSSLPLIVDIIIDIIEHAVTAHKCVWYRAFNLRSVLIVFNLLVVPVLFLAAPFSNQRQNEQHSLTKSGINAIYFVCLNLVSMLLVLAVTLLCMNSFAVTPRPLLLAIITLYGSSFVLEARRLLEYQAHSSSFDMDILRALLTALAWVCFAVCTFIWGRHLLTRLKDSGFSFNKFELHETEIITLAFM